MSLERQPEMDWLVGRSIKAIEKHESSWLFILDDGSTISTEEHWRLLFIKGLLVGSACHGSVRYHPDLADAAKWALSVIKDAKIRHFSTRPPTRDFLLSFDNGMVLEFLVLSHEREAWAVGLKDSADKVICTGGSGVGVYVKQD
jgi:hypothetical protein